MKFAHAVGFLEIVLLMVVLPQIAPGLCPRNGFDGTSGRQLWLHVMGALQVTLGGSVCLWNLTSAAMALAETLPEAIAGIWGQATAEPEADRGVAGDAGLVAFEREAEGAWSERRAA
ncbi:MAG: hypothetical protein NTV51_09710 [Verrucomicrobia bacterium]|nr:hypothetical protein [Verrucomicrobiota bacterium]